MDKAKLRNFAIEARIRLIERVTDRANTYGLDEETCKRGTVIPSKIFQKLDGTLLSQTEISQREALLIRIQSRGFQQVMEEAAYTWFNRFIALRYMQEHQLLPVSLRVLPDAPGALPELIRQAQNVELDGVDFAHVVELLEGNRTETLYTELLIALCNQLSGVLPQMFEPISDYTELLFPEGLLREDSVLALLAKVDAENWQDIQVIGWLYQYYNTELKNETFELLKKNVKITKERIGAATQLFTPEWIVRYMVENSLGRLWLEGHDDSALRQGWRYFMEEAEQEPQVAAQLEQIRAQAKTMQPEQIRLLDPCMGSGHILVYAFDVLMAIYRTQGYTDRDAVSAIIENNLYGLDIDDRAAQLAYFALMMKACEYDRRFLRRKIQPHVCAIGETEGEAHDNPAWSSAERRAANLLRQTFADAKEFGSILSIPKPLTDALEALGENPFGGQSVLGVDAENLQKLAAQAKIMARRYDVVVTNPPYMGSSGMGAKLAEFVKKEYPDSKSDLFAVFMERGREYAKENGYLAMITQHAWMFLSSFEKLRAKLMEMDTVSMAHLGARAFEEIGGEVVQTTAFVMQNRHIHGYKGSYARLIEPTTQAGKEKMFLDGENRFSARQDNFEKIPGAPVAYWVSEAVLRIFIDAPRLSAYGKSLQGTVTGDNESFMRLWYEATLEKFSIYASEKDSAKWFPYSKGGEFRKWYGNVIHTINWENNGYAIKNFCDNNGKLRSRPQNTNFFFKRGITWSSLTSGAFSGRYLPNNATFSDIGPLIVLDNEDYIYATLAFMNSKVFQAILDICCTGLHYQNGVIAMLPCIEKKHRSDKIDILAKECISKSHTDWDSYETSWDFKRHPMVGRGVTTVAEAYAMWAGECNTRFAQLKTNEEELNRIFIDIYGLQDELTPDVAEKDVTVYRIIDEPGDEERKMRYVLSMRDEITSLISYIVGCILGRYSPYVEGLLFAGGEWDDAQIRARIEEGAKTCDFADPAQGLFYPDADGIVPITDEAYFPDDIVERTAEFVRKVYGAETLEENLAFIAKAIGGKGETPREIIRNYYLNDFYADHLKTYQKRPIYWLCDSGKAGAFRALFYLHRYDRDTVGRVRMDYVHELQDRLRVQLDDARRAQESGEGRAKTMAGKRAQKLEKQLIELNQYEEQVHHLADMRIPLDLDDGVKVNYAKLGAILSKIK